MSRENQEPERPRGRREIRRRLRQLRREQEIEMVERLQTPLSIPPFAGGTPEPGLNAGVGETGNIFEGILPERARHWLSKHFPRK